MERRKTQQTHLSIVSLLLLMLLLLLEMWKETQAWPASLQYDLIVVSQTEPREPLYIALGYINDRLFLHYDGENRRAELQKPWNDTEEEREVWERMTGNLEERGKELRVILQDILRQNNHSDSNGGSHILQATLGCELQGNNSTREFWRFQFDGQDFLTFYLERHSCIAAYPVAQRIKEKWEDWILMKLHKIHEEEYCSIRLKRYLASWKEMLERTELPIEVPPGPNTLSHGHLQIELLIISIGLIVVVLVVVGTQLWRRIGAKPEIRPTRRSEWKSVHPLFSGLDTPEKLRVWYKQDLESGDESLYPNFNAGRVFVGNSL